MKAVVVTEGIKHSQARCVDLKSRLPVSVVPLQLNFFSGSRSATRPDRASRASDFQSGVHGFAPRLLVTRHDDGSVREPEHAQVQHTVSESPDRHIMDLS
jgi:hypothetical protein